MNSFEHVDHQIPSSCRKVIPIVRRCTSYCVGALDMCQQTGNAGKLYSSKSGIPGGSCEVYSCGQLLGRT